MSFLFVDPSKGQIIDILEDCTLSTLSAYFSRYCAKARASVTHIVMDMHEAYITLASELFPCA